MSNAFKILKSLIPEPPLLIGTVTAVDDGNVTVELPDGGTLSVRGEAAIDDKVFIRGGAIEGPAPDLPVEIINV